ncbi:hypothetical protein BG000_007364 [Podila horticola]|nr:hypothetical protein BG000_007364 [Podila horticola]
MDPEAQYQTEQEQAQLETYDGPIDPATEQAIQELTDAGSKAFVFQDYELAVEKFGLASEMLGQVYGEMSPKNADTLFLYGKALLDSRFVFEGDDDDDEEEEEEENGEGAAGAPAEGGEEGAQDDNDDFAVAWDVLDLARVLYHKIGTEEALLKLGDVHMALGDVSLESENFEQAVADFREALLVKEARLEADDRQLAEAHYKLALALEFSPAEANKASEHITKAIGVLKLRIEKLNGLLGSGKGKARANDASESETQMAKELLELHEFVGEMEQKIQDLASNQANKPLEDPSQVALFSQMLNAQKAQVANDISSLIKPKTNKVTESLASSSSSSSTTATVTTTTTTTTTTTIEAETSTTDESLKRKAEVSEEKSEEEADKKIKA